MGYNGHEHDDGDGLSNGNKLRADFWQRVSMYLIATSIGAAIAWLSAVSVFLAVIVRPEQVANTHSVRELERQLSTITSTGTDDRFRKSDWLKERAIIDIEHKSIYREIDMKCTRPPSLNR